jgi:hypothetical protein
VTSIDVGPGYVMSGGAAGEVKVRQSLCDGIQVGLVWIPVLITW